jgi:Winged helix-turn-helix DNA-binding
MTIEIDDDINALDVAVQDKIALATMRKRPRISNPALAKLLGVSDSGVRTLIRRFKATKLVKELKIEGTREFKVMVGDQDAGGLTCQKMTKIGTPEMRQKVTPTPPTGMTPAQRAIWRGQHFKKRFDSLYGNLVRGNHPDMCAYYAAEFTKLAEEIKACAEMADEPKRLLIRVVEHQRNHQAAGEFINQHVKGDETDHAWLRLSKAQPDQLSAFYERIQSGQLGAGNGQALIGIGPG